MAAIRSKGGLVLNKYLLARVFDYDGHAEEARAACIAKGWGDVRRGPPWMIETGSAYTTCVTISADNSMLAVCNNFDIYAYRGPGEDEAPLYDKHETVVYDVSSGEIRFKLSSSEFVTAAAFSPDSKAVAIGTKSDYDSSTYDAVSPWLSPWTAGTLSIYNIATDSSTEPRWERTRPEGFSLPEGAEGVSFVQFSPSGSAVFVGCVHDICALYEASSGQLVRRLQIWLRSVGSVITTACFASDSMLAVVAVGAGYKLMLFDTTTGLPMWEKSFPSLPARRADSFVDCVAFSQDRATLAVGSYSNSNVTLFDVATGEMHTELHTGATLAATCSHDSFLFTAVGNPSMVPSASPSMVPGIISFSCEAALDSAFRGDFYREDNKGWYATQWHRVPWYIREATNDTNIKRSELDLYGLGPYTGHKSAFSRDASIMVMQCRTSKKIALYDVATGKLRVKKRPPGRGVG